MTILQLFSREFELSIYKIKILPLSEYLKCKHHESKTNSKYQNKTIQKINKYNEEVLWNSEPKATNQRGE